MPIKYGSNANEYLPEQILAVIESGTMPLAAVRQWKQLSVEQLAGRSGVSVATIEGAEAGRELSLEAQVNLAWVLGVGADLFHE
ncbi:helix-turn-helix domain-containing protein [Kaistia sp. UC242_56]|uniref:helix-turn-helix domain-containing protein n=1 Tax=Kaistia sp. UC242_56 TaxID=3374625 RepID=UPI0037A66135